MTSAVDTRPSGSAAPPFYNAAVDLIERNLATRSEKAAFVDEQGTITYGELAQRVDRAAGALLALGIEPENRVLLALHDTIDFPTAFLGAIKAGIIPIAINTLLPAIDYAYILADSRAKAAIVSAPLLPRLIEAAQLSSWRGTLILSDPAGTQDAESSPRFDALLSAAAPIAEPFASRPDDACFWLYSSGSTGKPKGTVHAQTSMIQTAELFAQAILGFAETDVVFSAAKLFFAYGLGNALSFPMSVGATSVLFSARVTPPIAFDVLAKHRPTIFCAVPTLFAACLAHPAMPQRGEHSLRLCTSAGEVLPAEIGRSWTERTGVEIIDGIGSTEMLHIFISNRPGAVRYGTTGTPVPGYRARLIDEHGREAACGEIGELEIAGPTAALQYWNNRDKSRRTFAGEWTRTGDKFRVDEDGYYIHCGRTDDMLKVSGIWVSPGEVESALVSHDDVLESAVIGVPDEHELIKPKAFVILKPGVAPGDTLVEDLKAHVKSRLPPYAYPRWIEFLDELPKTATGKIQRHVLRAREAERRA
jgi:benzoate-CoA ligase